jgi:hypothetical protein
LEGQPPIWKAPADYPFASRLYPGALDVIRRIILSDGDVVFQPLKIERSGLWAAVEGRVLIYIHKEKMLDAVAERYPARHYAMIDDKLRILAAMKKTWQDRLTTIFLRQGHYALDPGNIAAYPPADITVERIGDLVSAESRHAAGQHDSRPCANRRNHEGDTTTA